MTMNYDFLFCGLHLRFEVPWELEVTNENRPFLVESGNDSQTPDMRVHFYPTEDLRIPEGKGFWAIDSYHVSEGNIQRIYHCPYRGQPPYCCVEWDFDNPQVVNCTYLEGEGYRIEFTRNLVELLGLEMFLLNFGGLILHSSVVNWQGNGILFSAPSGTGKSTQADLWEKYKGSCTINGDRAGIRKANGVWNAYGLPFAGTSGIYRNELVPIKAIVLLKQAPVNSITPVTTMEAFRKLMPECSARRWNPDFMDRLIGILSALVQAVPVYLLECRPDEEAVQVLYDTIMKD